MTSQNCKSLFFSVLLLAVTWSSAQRTLPKYNVDRLAISVSGASSGGCMATQLHVAYSSLIMGVGVLAGVPYYCAQNNPVLNLNSCGLNPDRIDTRELVLETNKYATGGDIDATFNMRYDRVFIYNGNQDTVVKPDAENKSLFMFAHQAMAAKVAEYYRNFVIPENVNIFRIDAEHTFPTENYGNACNVKRSPYISRCNYNAAYETLNYIYGNLTRPTGYVPLNGDFYLFDQSEFFYLGPPYLASMDTAGYVYVPSGCMYNQNKCKLHINLHGCEQGRDTLGDEQARNVGFNEVGELNNIIILSPQAIGAVLMGNPLGCWDWWGYTNRHYAIKKGDQMVAIYRMIERIS